MSYFYTTEVDICHKLYSDAKPFMWDVCLINKTNMCMNSTVYFNEKLKISILNMSSITVHFEFGMYPIIDAFRIFYSIFVLKYNASYLYIQKLN